MNTFSSTLDLQGLAGFDTGISTNSSNSTPFFLKLFFIVLFVVGLFYYFHSSVQKKEGDVSEKMKLLR
jgi:hypothetical protein